MNSSLDLIWTKDLIRTRVWTWYEPDMNLIWTRVRIRFRLELEPDKVSGSYRVQNPINFLSSSGSGLNLVRILGSGFAELEFGPGNELRFDPFADLVGLPGLQPWLGLLDESVVSGQWCKNKYSNPVIRSTVLMSDNRCVMSLAT